MAFKDLMPWSKNKNSGLARRNENDPFVTLREEMNRLFDNFPSGFEMTPFADVNNWSPKVNLSETNETVQVSAELPGMDEKDINVTLEHGVLTIKGEKKEEHEQKEQNYHRVERSYGSFQRSLQLPCEVDENKVTAEYKKGVLNLTLPKTRDAQSNVRKIPVKAS